MAMSTPPPKKEAKCVCFFWGGVFAAICFPVGFAPVAVYFTVSVQFLVNMVEPVVFLKKNSLWSLSLVSYDIQQLSRRWSRWVMHKILLYICFSCFTFCGVEIEVNSIHVGICHLRLIYSGWIYCSKLWNDNLMFACLVLKSRNWDVVVIDLCSWFLDKQLFIMLNVDVIDLCSVSLHLKCSSLNSSCQAIETPYGRKSYKEDLVGCRIKVWWPLDRR